MTILEGYGMTETTALSHMSPYNRPKVGSLGIPIPNVIAAIVEVDGTGFMPVNEVGELIVHGRTSCRGTGKGPRKQRRP